MQDCQIMKEVKTTVYYSHISFENDYLSLTSRRNFQSQSGINIIKGKKLREVEREILEFS